MYSYRTSGYIEQQIEQMTLFIARLIGLKTDGKYEAVQDEIGIKFQSLNGLNLKIALHLDEDSLISNMQSRDGFDAARAVVTAMLLEENADIADRQNLLGSQQASLRCAIRLYAKAVEANLALRTEEFGERINRCLIQLGDKAYTAEIRKRLGMPF